MEMDVNKRTESWGWKFYKNDDNSREFLRNDKLDITLEGYAIGDFEEDGLVRVRKNISDYFASLVDKNGKIQDYVTSGFFNFSSSSSGHNKIPYTRKVFDAKNPQAKNPKYRDVSGVVFDKNDFDFVKKCEVAKRMALYLLGKDKDGNEGLTLEDLIKPMGKSKERFYDCFKESAHVKSILFHEKSMLAQWAEQLKARAEKATTFEEKKQISEEKEKWLQRKAYVDAFVRDACDKTMSVVENKFENESNELSF